MTSPRKFWLLIITAVLSGVLYLPNPCKGENILFFFGISTYSHRIPVWPLVEKLVEKGHNVTFLSPFPPKSPNPRVHEFTPKEIRESLERNTEGPIAFKLRSQDPDHPKKSWFGLPQWGYNLCEVFLNSPTVKEWMKSVTFDLVIIDGLYNDCGLGLAYKFKAPHMLYDTTSFFMWQLEALGIPSENSWIPDMQYFPSQNMSFYERALTVGNTLYWHFDRKYRYFPKLTELMRRKLNMPDLPDLSEMEKNASLVFLNTHYSEEFPRSLPPYVIPVGGMHISEKIKPLPKEFEDFIATKPTQGFVYISFGSSVQISKAPPEIYNAFIQAIKRLDVNFFWKWEGDNVPKNLPPNLFMQKWMPQQDILAHPKIKAFVTHSGLMSIQEAIYHGVPLVSMPVFSEQDYNAERIHKGGYGARLEITTVTAEQLVAAITKITTEPSYKREMLKKSKAFRDRPMKALDSALWWTEFVLRNKGETSFLKPRSIYQTWYIRRSLDVYGTAFVVLIFVGLILLKAAKFALGMCLPFSGQTQVSVPGKTRKTKTS